MTESGELIQSLTVCGVNGRLCGLICVDVSTRSVEIAWALLFRAPMKDDPPEGRSKIVVKDW